jgi:hypothetical protein
MKGRHLRIWGFVPRRRARLAQCTNAGKPTPGRTLLTAGNSGVLGLSAVASADRQRPKSAHSAIPGAKPVRLAPRRDQRHSGRTNRTARGRRKVRLWFATACPVCTPAQVADDRLPGRGPLPPPGEALDAALIRAHPRNSTCAALRNRQVRNSPSVGDDVGSSDPPAVPRSRSVQSTFRSRSKHGTPSVLRGIPVAVSDLRVVAGGSQL